MKINVYTDGSSKKDRLGSCTAIIFSDNDFLGAVTEASNFKGNDKAELKGVINGLEYILNNKLDRSDITIFTDYKKIVNVYYNRHSEKNIIYKEQPLWERLFELSGKLHFNIKLVKGHQKIFNPNKTCDILARLRLYKS